MIPERVQKWLSADYFPQRVLLSGPRETTRETALHAASQLQGVPMENILNGGDADTMFFADSGKSFKIDYSDAAKRDGQGEYENVRGLIRWAHQHPQTGKYRIAILENFERVSRDAPHALLKLIEEPPTRTIFIFTTENHHRLLDTIISRMLVVPVVGDDLRVNNGHTTLALDFLKTDNLLQRFQIIGEVEKQAKDEGKIMYKNFTQELIHHSRTRSEYQSRLKFIFDTYQALEQNVNPKFTLERLALITQK